MVPFGMVIERKSKATTEPRGIAFRLISNTTSLGLVT